MGKHNQADVNRGFARLDFAPEARPAGEEVVAEDGDKLFGLCRAAGVNHLIYAGFANNWCLLLSPGGMHDMSGRGSNEPSRDNPRHKGWADSLVGLAQIMPTARRHASAADQTWSSNSANCAGAAAGGRAAPEARAAGCVASQGSCCSIWASGAEGIGKPWLG